MSTIIEEIIVMREITEINKTLEVENTYTLDSRILGNLEIQAGIKIMTIRKLDIKNRDKENRIVRYKIKSYNQNHYSRENSTDRYSRSKKLQKDSDKRSNSRDYK